MFEREPWVSKNVIDQVGEPLPYHDRLIHRFVLEAIAQGVTNEYVQESSRYDPERALEMLGWYCFTPATLEDIAERYSQPYFEKGSITRQAVSQNIKDTLRDVYEHAPDSFKEKVRSWIRENPWQGVGDDEVIAALLEKRKPITFIENGLDISIHSLLRKKLPPSEIRERLGLNSKNWHTIRTYWQRRGVEIPRNDIAWSEKVLRETSPDEPEWIQAAFNAVTKRAYELLRGVEGNDALILPLSVVAKEAGLYGYQRDMGGLMASLQEVQEDGEWIPVGKLAFERQQDDGTSPQHRYYFIDARHKKRAIERMTNDPTLESMRESVVSLLCGEWEEELPSTYALLRDGRYLAVSKALEERGVVVKGEHSINAREFFVGGECRVPVFELRGSCYLDTSDYGWEEALDDYIEEKKRQYGL